MQSATGLILFSHGSLLCGAGQTLREHAGRIRATGEYSAVEVGFMNYSSPTFTEAVACCVEAGCKRIVVVPYFLFQGYFVSKAMPSHVENAQRDRPDVEFVMAGPIGFDESIEDAIIGLAKSARSSDEWDLDIRSAVAHCELNTECPNYPNCSEAAVK